MQCMSRPIVLVFVSHYLPGYKCGGPIRSISNMIERLSSECEFKVVTADRDFTETVPYPGIIANSWSNVGSAKVYYISPDNISVGYLARLTNSTRHDILYLNSGFDPVFTLRLLLARHLGLLPKRRTVVASRGVFSSGALGLKRIKKRAFISLSKIVGLFRGVVWHASSEFEKSDIKRWFGCDANVMVAPDPASCIRLDCDIPIKREKAPGSLSIVFISRISPMKNLEFVLTSLSSLKGSVRLDIYGPIEDSLYWGKCQKVIAGLPHNVRVSYCGPLSHEEVYDAFAAHDLFFFPTLGENYGHVILESLLAGCPVLLSDMTPWRGLAELGCGWDFSLEKPEAFRETLQSCVDMGPEEYGAFRDAARKHALGIVNDSAIVNANKFLFQTS